MKYILSKILHINIIHNLDKNIADDYVQHDEFMTFLLVVIFILQ